MHPVLKTYLKLWRSDKAYPIEVVYPWDEGRTMRRIRTIEAAGIKFRRLPSKTDGFDLYFFRTELDAAVARESTTAAGLARPMTWVEVDEEGVLRHPIPEDARSALAGAVVRKRPGGVG